ncbi:MAG TPA: hypothetical protein VGY13_07310 [Solirubrobacteraceae bacterium]|jgi:hypothetical protein|nr:hypothetical protein [Solirubrobacteraceae bacterium]
MIVLVLIAAWIAVLSLVMGLCASARAGDAQLARADGAPAADMPRDASEPVRIAVRPGSRGTARAGEADGSLARDSVAA